MSIFDQAKTEFTGFCVVDAIRPMEVVMESGATGNLKEFTTDRNKEWAVKLTFVQKFWANDVQRSHVQRYAIDLMAETLFADVRRELSLLRLAIESGDKRGAIEATFRIEKATQP